MLDALYSFYAQGGTPLRRTLVHIGDYLENANSGGRTLFPNDDAYLTAASGGACQQSFVILMSDGWKVAPNQRLATLIIRVARMARPRSMADRMQITSAIPSQMSLCITISVIYVLP